MRTSSMMWQRKRVGSKPTLFDARARRHYAQMGQSARCAFCAIFHIAIGCKVCYNDKAMRGNPKAVKKKVLKIKKSS